MLYPRERTSPRTPLTCRVLSRVIFSYIPDQSWQAPTPSHANAASSAAEDSDPSEDKRVQADLVDITGSSGAPVYDAGALAAFLRLAAPMMEQEIKRGAKSTALRRAGASPRSQMSVADALSQGLERGVVASRRLCHSAACTAARILASAQTAVTF